MKIIKLTLIFILCLLSSCGGGSSTPTPTPTYSIGGTVSGLTSDSLVLKNNNGDDLTIPANSTSFTFNSALVSGAIYAGTVGAQPAAQTCTVSHGSGTIATLNIANIIVTCKSQFAYVVNSSANTVSMYSIGSDGILTPLNVPTVATGNLPNGITINPAGTFAYVTNTDFLQNTNPSISMYSIGTNGILTPLSTPTVVTGLAPQEITINLAGTFAYETNMSSNTVSMFSIGIDGVLKPLSTPTVATYGVATSPAGISVNPAGTFAYVAVSGFNSVQGYAIGSDGVITFSQNIHSGQSPTSVAINPAGTFAYVANHGSGSNNINIYSIGSDGSLAYLPGVTVVAAGTSPYSITINPAGTFAYVSNWAVVNGSNTISMYSIGTNGMLTALSTPTVATGNRPTSIAINAAGTFAYVTNEISNTVSMYAVDVSTGILTPLSTPTVSTGAGSNPSKIVVLSK